LGDEVPLILKGGRSPPDAESNGAISEQNFANPRSSMAIFRAVLQQSKQQLIAAEKLKELFSMELNFFVLNELCT
jgi:hypothetical protein